MIGYLILQELGNLLPFEKPLATLLTMIEVDPDDPSFQNPTKPIGPIYGSEEANRLAGEKGWPFKSDGPSMRRVVPSPRPKRIASAALAGDRAACEFVSQTGDIAAIGSIDEAQGLLHGTAGTRVAPDPDPPVGSLGAPRTTDTAR